MTAGLVGRPEIGPLAETITRRERPTARAPIRGPARNRAADPAADAHTRVDNVSAVSADLRYRVRRSGSIRADRSAPPSITAPI